MNGLVHLAVETWAQGRFALFGEAFWAPRPQLRELRRTMGPSCAVLWSGDYQGLAGRRCSKASGAGRTGSRPMRSGTCIAALGRVGQKN